MSRLKLDWVWRLGGLSPLELVKRTGREVVRDDLLGSAAKLSFYFLLALFPMLIFLSAVLGQVFAGNEDLYNSLLGHLSAVMPDSAFRLVRQTMNEITTSASGGKISLGLLATLWAASSGMQALIMGLNFAYDVTELRVWWKRRIVAISLTVLLSVVSVVALSLWLFGGRLGSLLAAWFGLGQVFEAIWFMLRFVVVPVFVLLVFTIIYRFAPNIRVPGWQALLPGAVVGSAVWFGASALFRLYLEYFDTYSRTYGSLGAVIILMMWLYVSSGAVLLGGEVNSEIRKAAADAGVREAQQVQGDAD